MRETWNEYQIGDIAEVQTGPFGSQLHAKDYVDEGIPVIMPTNILDNLRLDITDIKRISENDRNRLTKYALEKGDIVYSRRGDVEKCCLINSHQTGWLCGTGCLFVRIKDTEQYYPHFIGYQLCTPQMRGYIRGQAVGSTMPNLNTKILSDVPLKIPPLPEQKAIASTLSALDRKSVV